MFDGASLEAVDLDVLELTERIAHGLEFRPMLAGDALLLELQDSQHFELGLFHSHFTFEQGEQLADNGLAWAAVRGTRIVAIAGFLETYKGQAVAWAALSGQVGADHLAITRYARMRIAEVIERKTYHRIECLIEADNEAAMTWAMCIGLELGYRMRAYGAEATDHFLFEKVAR